MTARGETCRFAMNLANAALVGVAADGTLYGRTVEIAVHVAACLGQRQLLVRYDTASDVLADVEVGWDIAFLAIDPARTDTVAYTRPYLTLDVGCATRVETDFTESSTIDRPGVAIACARGAYVTAVWQRITRATIVDVSTPTDALCALVAGESTWRSAWDPRWMSPRVSCPCGAWAARWLASSMRWPYRRRENNYCRG